MKMTSIPLLLGGFLLLSSHLRASSLSRANKSDEPTYSQSKLLPSAYAKISCGRRTIPQEIFREIFNYWYIPRAISVLTDPLNFYSSDIRDYKIKLALTPNFNSSHFQKFHLSTVDHTPTFQILPMFPMLPKLQWRERGKICSNERCEYKLLFSYFDKIKRNDTIKFTKLLDVLTKKIRDSSNSENKSSTKESLLKKFDFLLVEISKRTRRKIPIRGSENSDPWQDLFCKHIFGESYSYDKFSKWFDKELDSNLKAPTDVQAKVLFLFLATLVKVEQNMTNKI